MKLNHHSDVSATNSYMQSARMATLYNRDSMGRLGSEAKGNTPNCPFSVILCLSAGSRRCSGGNGRRG